MKKYLPLLIVVFLAACGGNEQAAQEEQKGLLSTDLVNNPHSAQGVDTTALKDLPVMDFKDTVHNFGTISEGEKAMYDFEFTNNGKTPLIISDAKGSCGCTIADFPKDPIAPGSGGKIAVVFNSEGKKGHQEKSISLVTNTARSRHMLYFKGEVEEDKNKK